MIDSAHIPEVAADEIVARYILFDRHVRSNKTVKADSFVPHPHLDLSVTRHRSASEGELWQVGETVASIRGLTLQGRADVGVEVIHAQKLDTVPDPLPGNPNHANVKEWPAEKAAQKIIAAELAKLAVYRPRP